MVRQLRRTSSPSPTVPSNTSPTVPSTTPPRSAPVSTPPVAPHQHVTSLPHRVSVGSTAGTSGYVRNPIREDERAISESYQQDTLSPTVALTSAPTEAHTSAPTAALIACHA
ncbi:hypothetical protein V5799_000989 [Amblyomma americanum]|uniref:Uncharacterized protein n=1 Tax=Amblyomma americanum TaxID=6943 RepID=A0AAQ4D1G9_AMBAM